MVIGFSEHIGASALLRLIEPEPVVQSQCGLYKLQAFYSRVVGAHMEGACYSAALAAEQLM